MKQNFCYCLCLLMAQQIKQKSLMLLIVACATIKSRIFIGPMGYLFLSSQAFQTLTFSFRTMQESSNMCNLKYLANKPSSQELDYKPNFFFNFWLISRLNNMQLASQNRKRICLSCHVSYFPYYYVLNQFAGKNILKGSFLFLIFFMLLNFSFLIQNYQSLVG